MALLSIFRRWIVLASLLFASIALYSAVHAGTLELSWADNSNNEDGFQIDRLVAGLIALTLTPISMPDCRRESSTVTGSGLSIRREIL